MRIIYIIPFIFSAVFAESLNILRSGEISPNFDFVGDANGKRYYIDDTNKLNWYEASYLCVSFGMKLATIEKMDQAAFLNSMAGIKFRGNFWTGGKDARELRQFSWDGTDTQPASHPADNAELDVTLLTPRTCLGYNADIGTVNRYVAYDCNSRTAAALCEI